MRQYKYSYAFQKGTAAAQTVKVGVAGSGNLEVIIRSSPSVLEFIVSTVIDGFQDVWKAVIDRFVQEYPHGGLTYILQDAGATPAVVALRLRQAFETYQNGYRKGENYLELDARARIYSLVDENRFKEFLLEEDCNSPNLPNVHMQTEDDDGVVIGIAKINRASIAIASQQKDFIGGSVGEVHGAKLIGLMRYAIRHRLEGMVFLIDSGGVRLQEANVGEIEISEMIRCLLEVKSAGIKTIGVICGNNGAFGGMGIFSGALDALIVNQTARIGVSGAEVIQAVRGIEVFDGADRSLVWRVYGGRTRFMQRAARYYASHHIADIQKKIVEALQQLDSAALISYENVLEEQKALQKRIASSGSCSEQGQWLRQTSSGEFLKQNLFDIDDEAFVSLMKQRNS